MSKKYIIIPDCQVKPGQDWDYLRWAGNYCVRKKPDVVICLGDFADMPSLSLYDVGTREFEGRRYKSDIEAVQKAQEAFFAPFRELDALLKERKKGPWRPELHMLYGNHEHRIVRATNQDAKLTGTIGLEDLKYKDFGWTTHEFLKPLVLDGIAFCHYFVSGVMGRPITTAQSLLTKKHMSCIAGHQQGRQIATSQRADGKTITGIISGSFYEADQDYLTPQTVKHWSGIIVLHEVEDGEFSEMFVSLEYLRQKYSSRNAWRG